MGIVSRAVAVNSALVLAVGEEPRSLARPPRPPSRRSASANQWDSPHAAKTSTTVSLRTGPGTSYTSLELLARGTGSPTTV